MSASSFESWLEIREIEKMCIREVMIKHFTLCKGDINKIINLVWKEYNMSIIHGNSYLGFVQDLMIELSAKRVLRCAN